MCDTSERKSVLIGNSFSLYQIRQFIFDANDLNDVSTYANVNLNSIVVLEGDVTLKIAYARKFFSKIFKG